MAGYAFYRYGAALSTTACGSRLLGLVQRWPAWMSSLFWINGILSWQLTPGGWVTQRTVWSGFFNPSFWPSLLFRTVVCLALAGLAALVVVNAMRDLEDDERRALVRHASRFLAPMAGMPLLGLWFFAVVPADSRGWVLGGSAWR
jgi:cytochrome d ubiquinol oxidase subunit I